jgi:hypothetical protein
LQRFAQLVKQARVFNGYDGLRSEVVYERDPLIGERSYLLAVDTMLPTNSPSLSIGTNSIVRAPAPSTKATTRGLRSM